MQDSGTDEVINDARRLGELLRMIAESAMMISKRNAMPEADRIRHLAREITKLAAEFEALRVRCQPEE